MYDPPVLPRLFISAAHPWALAIPSNNNQVRILFPILYPSSQLGHLLRGECREERGRKSSDLASPDPPWQNQRKHRESAREFE